MSSNSAELVIRYHIAAGEVDTNWLSLCNLITKSKKEDKIQEDKKTQDLIALHRQKLQNVKAQEEALKLSDPHWYTSKKIDMGLLVLDFILGGLTLGVGIWDYKFQQDLPGNVQRSRALFGCIVTATVVTFVYTGVKVVRAYVKANVKKGIARRLEMRRVAMREQEKAFDLFCEYLQTQDPKLQTEKMHGIVHHLKQIPPEFGSAYKGLDDFLSELIRIAQSNEETKKLVDELVQIQKKRRSVDAFPKEEKDPKDLKEKTPIDKLAESRFLKTEKADKASAPHAKESFRLLQKMDDLIDIQREKEIWAKIKAITGHHFNKINAEGEELVNPLEEPKDDFVIDIDKLYPQPPTAPHPSLVAANADLDVRIEVIQTGNTDKKNYPPNEAPD